MDLRLDALLDLIYYWLTKDAEEEAVQRIDAELWLPPAGKAAPKESPWSDEATKASLAAFAGVPGGAVI